MGSAGPARAAKGWDRDQRGSKVVFTVVWWVEGCEHERVWGRVLGSCGLSMVDSVLCAECCAAVGPVQCCVLSEAGIIHRKGLSLLAAMTSGLSPAPSHVYSHRKQGPDLVSFWPGSPSKLHFP